MKKTSGKTILMVIIAVLFSFFSTPAPGQSKAQPTAVYGQGRTELVVATGSPGALGLLQALAEPFCRQNHCRLVWFKKGSGASLAFLKAGKCDLIMVHAPAAEKKAIAEGWASERAIIGANQFFIVGPRNDPAGISQTKSAVTAFRAIANAKAKFISRGDNSGTNKRELQIWRLAGLKPNGKWYLVSHDFMGPSLLLADRKQAYFMTDNSTYYVKKSKLQHLVPLFQGDPILFNVYHALRPNPAKYPRRNNKLALTFINFIKSATGQKIIRSYGIRKYGRSLYQDAAAAKKLEKKLITEQNQK